MYWLLAIVVFVMAPIFLLGYLGLFLAWRDRSLPFPERPHPRFIFRLVRRDERAVYVRIMRRTMAVQMRDMNRAVIVTMRAIGKQLLPPVKRLADALSAALDRR
jgi:hypothetical protein